MSRALAIASAAVLCWAGTGAPAGAAGDMPRLLDDETRAPPTISLMEQDFAIPPGANLRARYELFGPVADELALALGAPPAIVVDPDTGLVDAEATTGSNPLDEYEIRVTSHVPVSSRPQLIEALNGLLGNALDGARVAPQQALRLRDDGVVELELDVPVTGGGQVADELVMALPGLHPVTVEVRHRGELKARHLTFVERLAPESSGAAYRLAVLATVTDPGPEPSARELDDLGLRLRELADLATLARDAGGALSVDLPPAALAALDDDPELREQLAAALGGTELLAAPDIVLDPSSMAEAGRQDDYTRALRRGEDLLVEAFPSAAVRRTASMDAEAPSAAGASMLRDLGTRLLIVPFEEYLEITSSATGVDPSLLIPVALPDGAEMDLVAVDPVSRLISPDAAGLRTPAERAVVILAELVAHEAALGPRQRVAVIGPDAPALPDADVTVQLARMVNNHPRLALEQVSTVAGLTDVRRAGDGPGATPVPLPESTAAPLTQRAERIDRTALRAIGVASMLPDDDPRPADWSDRLTRLLSSAYTESQVVTALRVLDTELDAVPAAVELPEPFTFTLTGRASEVGLRILNSDSTPLTVVLHPEAPKLAFPEGPLETVLEPGLNVIDIPVQTLSNGTFPVTITARAPLGEVLVDQPLVLTARVNAVTGLGQVITVGALLVLVTWWYNHLRKRRRERADELEDAGRARHPTATGTGDMVSGP